jgi:hypothetical protein
LTISKWPRPIPEMVKPAGLQRGKGSARPRTRIASRSQSASERTTKSDQAMNRGPFANSPDRSNCVSRDQRSDDRIFFAALASLFVVNGERWSESLTRRFDYRQVCRRPTMNLLHIPLTNNAGKRASAVGRNRATNRIGELKKAHQKVISSGELFVRALAIESDLSRRLAKQPKSKTLLNEQHKHERLVSQLAREYKNAMAEYRAVIRTVLKH